MKPHELANQCSPGLQFAGGKENNACSRQREEEDNSLGKIDRFPFFPSSLCLSHGNGRQDLVSFREEIPFFRQNPSSDAASSPSRYVNPIIEPTKEPPHGVRKYSL
jgi:hypothetical protein